MLLSNLSNMISLLLPARKPSKSMERKEVRKALIDALQPLLVAQGFTHFQGAIAWRRSAQWIDVVEIDFVDTVSYHRDSPTLGVGRYLAFAPRDPFSREVKVVEGQLSPTSAECHLRKVMFRLDQAQGTSWVVRDERDLLACCAEAQRLLKERVFPWFVWLDDMGTILKLLRKGKPDVEGNSRDPMRRGTWNYDSYFSRQVVAGIAAFRLGQWTLCSEILAPVLERGGLLVRNKKVIQLPAQSLSLVRKAFEAANLRKGTTVTSG